MGSKLNAGSLQYTNPVFPEYFADPFVFRHSNRYYAVGTSPSFTGSEWGAFRTLTSTDLIDWQTLGPALVKPKGYEQGEYWAPEIAEHEGLFYMYYSVGRADKDHQLRVATAEHPEGPYHDQGRLTSEELPFAIDGHPYKHTDGQWYLFFAIDLLDGDRAGTSIVVDRLDRMDRLAGDIRVVARATQDWQRYQADRPMYGGLYDWHTLEGPFVVRHQGQIYCLYSGGNWQNETYGVDYVQAEHPLGPYCDRASIRPRVLSTERDKVLGPGHNSVVLAPDGSTQVVVYHAWDSQRTARTMRIDPLIWTDEGPRCHGPTVTPQSPDW